LIFRVLQNAVHPDWYATREHRRFQRDEWEADVRIVEGGHVVSWSSRSLRLTEVLVDRSVELPRKGLLYEVCPRQERSAVLQPAEGFEYQTCLESERLGRDVFRHVCEELVLDGDKSGLFHREASTDRLAPAPISRVHVEARARGLTIHTFHTFPQEHAILRTQSLFEVRVPARRRG
jgi:hypothetical protein